MLVLEVSCIEIPCRKSSSAVLGIVHNLQYTATYAHFLWNPNSCRKWMAEMSEPSKE